MLVRARRSRPLAWSPRTWTRLGGIAIVLWATWPVLSLQTRDLPPFESMTGIFLVAWMVMALLPRSRAVDVSDRALISWAPAIAFALGESGSTVLFLLSTRHISAAQANLIIFLWPAITVALSAMLGIFQLRLRQVIGLLVGFAGVAVLIGANLSASLPGATLAFLGSLAWSFYCVFRLKWQRGDESLLLRGFAICAALCAVLHWMLEPWVLPSAPAALAVAIIGIVPTGIANALWDRAFRRGDSRLLAVMAYGTPLVSAVLLTLLGYQSYSWRLAIGALVIVAAGILSRIDESADNSGA